MKKILGMLGAALLVTVAASATPITTECTVNGNNGGAAGANGGNTLSATFTCAGFAAPGSGNVVTLAQLTYTTSYTGAQPSTSFTYTWTPAFGFATEVITGSSAFASQPNVFSGSPVNATSSSTIQNATSGMGGAQFNSNNPFLVTVAVSGGTLNINGQIYTDLTITYDYSSGAPEPATLSIMGSGLLALGVLLRKRNKKA